jgi:hypothetical protein
MTTITKAGHDAFQAYEPKTIMRPYEKPPTLEIVRAETAGAFPWTQEIHFNLPANIERVIDWASARMLVRMRYTFQQNGADGENAEFHINVPKAMHAGLAWIENTKIQYGSTVIQQTYEQGAALAESFERRLGPFSVINSKTKPVEGLRAGDARTGRLLTANRPANAATSTYDVVYRPYIPSFWVRKLEEFAVNKQMRISIQPVTQDHAVATYDNGITTGDAHAANTAFVSVELADVHLQVPIVKLDPTVDARRLKMSGGGGQLIHREFEVTKRAANAAGTFSISLAGVMPTFIMLYMAKSVYEFDRMSTSYSTAGGVAYIRDVYVTYGSQRVPIGLPYNWTNEEHRTEQMQLLERKCSPLGPAVTSIFGRNDPIAANTYGDGFGFYIIPLAMDNSLPNENKELLVHYTLPVDPNIATATVYCVKVTERLTVYRDGTWLNATPVATS